MGRPINKKYFGNTPSSEGIGGEGVASVTLTSAGNYNGELPTVSFSGPSIPGGVTAEGTIHGKAVEFYSFAVNGNGYALGNTLTVVGGTKTTTTTATVTGLIHDLSLPFMTNDGIGYQTNDDIVFSGAGWTSNLVIRVGNVDVDGSIIDYTLPQRGYYTGPDPAPTSNVEGVSPNGSGATFNLYWGVRDASVAEEGDYTAVPANPVSFTGGGSGATANVRWGVKTVEMTVNGSGYVNTTDAAPTFTAPVIAGVGTATATGNSVLQAILQNAIVAVDLSTSNIVDIVKQEGSSSYWVWTGSEEKLLNLASSSDSVGLYIEATDNLGGTYWVKKIASRRVTLGTAGGTGTQFGENETTTWTLDTPVAGVSVKIRNAA